MFRSGYPDLKNGYLKIANELFAAMIAYPFTSAEFKVVSHIIRKTYGWNKKEDAISVESISAPTTLSTRHTRRIIKKLVLDKVIKKDKKTKINVLSINKAYPQWRLWITLPTLTRVSVTNDQHVRKTLTQVSPTKDNKKQLFKNKTIDTINNTFREYIRMPMPIKSILSKWRK